jgi:hypothetical protein
MRCLILVTLALLSLAGDESATAAFLGKAVLYFLPWLYLFARDI